MRILSFVLLGFAAAIDCFAGSLPAGSQRSSILSFVSLATLGSEISDLVLSSTSSNAQTIRTTLNIKPYPITLFSFPGFDSFALRGYFDGTFLSGSSYQGIASLSYSPRASSTCFTTRNFDYINSFIAVINGSNAPISCAQPMISMIEHMSDFLGTYEGCSEFATGTSFEYSRSYMDQYLVAGSYPNQQDPIKVLARIHQQMGAIPLESFFDVIDTIRYAIQDLSQLMVDLTFGPEPLSYPSKSLASKMARQFLGGDDSFRQQTNCLGSSLLSLIQGPIDANGKIGCLRNARDDPNLSPRAVVSGLCRLLLLPCVCVNLFFFSFHFPVRIMVTSNSSALTYDLTMGSDIISSAFSWTSNNRSLVATPEKQMTVEYLLSRAPGSSQRSFNEIKNSLLRSGLGYAQMDLEINECQDDQCSIMCYGACSQPWLSLDFNILLSQLCLRQCFPLTLRVLVWYLVSSRIFAIRNDQPTPWARLLVEYTGARRVFDHFERVRSPVRICDQLVVLLGSDVEVDLVDPNISVSNSRYQLEPSHHQSVRHVWYRLVGIDQRMPRFRLQQSVQGPW